MLVVLGAVIGPVVMVLMRELTRYVVAGRQHAAWRSPWTELLAVRRPPGARLATVLAGSLVSYLWAAGLAFAVYACFEGPDREARIVISDVREGYDAQGKLSPGDEIIAIDGQRIGRGAQSVSQLINAKAGLPVVVTVSSEQGSRDVTLQPTLSDDRYGSSTWRIGIVTRRIPIRGDIGPSAIAALEFPASHIGRMISTTIDSVTTTTEDPGGAIRIVESFAPSRETRAEQALRLTMLLSAQLLLFLLLLDVVRLIVLARDRSAAR
ncbi:MAG: PDZ domain-containing protein [Kofleriaceae bacterium]